MCNMSDFKKYNNCLISNLLPHEVPDTSNIKEMIKKEKVILARWTTCFDNEKNSEWWYLIKDTPYDKEQLKSKDKYEINKGIKNFYVEIINPISFLNELYEIFVTANNGYSKLSKTTITRDEFFKKIDENNIYIGAFERETKKLCAYSVCSIKTDVKKIKKVMDLSIIKSLPSKKSKGVNAALMDYICNEYINKKKVNYICDGERSIRHITNFQNYLIKYFGFRKAYSKLNIEYNCIIKMIVKTLYPFRHFLKLLSTKFDNRYIYNIYCILYQEEIKRSFQQK